MFIFSWYKLYIEYPVPVAKIRDVEKDLISHFRNDHSALVSEIETKKEINSENEVKVIEIVKNFVAKQKFDQ